MDPFIDSVAAKLPLKSFEGKIANNDYKQASGSLGEWPVATLRTVACDAYLLMPQPISATIPLPVFPRGKES
jgi:hypothetical protein